MTRESELGAELLTDVVVPGNEERSAVCAREDCAAGDAGCGDGDFSSDIRCIVDGESALVVSVGLVLP